MKAFNELGANEAIKVYLQRIELWKERWNREHGVDGKKKKKKDKGRTPTDRPRPNVVDGHLSNLITLRNGLKLKEYQKEGVDWLCYNWHEHRSVLLCDEMGLGKTCQSIAFLSYLETVQKIEGPHLVVAPLSTLIHWRREMERFSGLYAVVFQGNKECRSMIEDHELYFEQKGKRVLKFNALIVSYDMAMNERRYVIYTLFFRE